MQISSNCLSNIARQRQPRNSLAFAMEDELTCSPIDIVELKSRDLTAAKSESSQQKHNGEATPAHVGAAVATVQKLLKLSRRNELGYTGLSPTRDCRHSAHQIVLEIAANVQEA